VVGKQRPKSKERGKRKVDVLYLRKGAAKVKRNGAEAGSMAARFRNLHAMSESARKIIEASAIW
jgi:hypothetical protein